MHVRTDDEVYRVDAVWLGPPKATFPWRARYVAWGVGIVVFLLVLAAERRMGIGFGFFSTGWAVVITIAVTRLICSRISHERPLSAVMVMWLRELTAPRKAAGGKGGAASVAKIRMRSTRPRPKQGGRSGNRRSKQPGAAISRRDAGYRREAGPRGDAASRTDSQRAQGSPAARPERSRAERTRADRSAARAGRNSKSSRRSKEVRGVRSRARS